MKNGSLHEWHPVSAEHPCTICDKPDWCGWSGGTAGNPEVVHCMRIESSEPTKGGGWIHFSKDREVSTYTKAPRTRGKRPSVDVDAKRKPKPDFATAAEAVASLEKTLGPRSADWTYFDGDGQPVQVVCRWDLPDGKKTIRPVSKRGDRWVIEALPSPRPLYNLPAIADADTIVLVEGEKAAAALNRMGQVATTSSGGCKAADKTDFSPLAGKRVVVWRDNDPPGEAYQRDVLALLAKLQPPPEVTVLPIESEWGDGYDAADWIRDGGTAEEFTAMVEAAEVVEFRQQEPIGYQPFPVDCFPGQLRDYVVALADSIGVDATMVSMPLLAAMAAAIGNSRNVRVRPGWEEICSLYVGLVGESGSGKTPAAKGILAPLRERDARANRRREVEDREFEQRQAEYDADLSAWKTARKKGGVEPAPEKPTRPPRQRYLLVDATPEKTAEVLDANPRGVCLVADELSALIGCMGRYDGNKGAERGAILSAWSGEAMIVDRKVAASAYAEHPRLTIFGGIQPDLVHRIIGDDDLAAGLPARFLWALPPTPAIRWSTRRVPDHLESTLVALFAQLYSLAPNVEADEDGNEVEKPVPLLLTRDATAMMHHFVDSNAELADNATGGFRAALAKVPAQAARLAMVLHCAADALGEPTGTKITGETMAKAITLASWFRHEAQRLYGLRGESEEDRARRELVEWIQRHGGETTPRELVQGMRRFADTSAAEQALNELAGVGLGAWHVVPTAGRPKRVFRLHGASTSTKAPETRDIGTSVYVDTDEEPEVENDDPLAAYEWNPADHPRDAWEVA